MTELTIFNTIISLIIVYKFLSSRFTIEWRKTFWMKKKYGFEITYWRQPKHPRQGTVILGWDFIPKETAEKGDYERYKAEFCTKESAHDRKLT